MAKENDFIKEAFKDFVLDACPKETFQMGLQVRKDLEPKVKELQNRSKKGFSKALSKLVELAIESTEI